MPQDINDKIQDFELMLEGFVEASKDLCPSDQARIRLMSYWYAMSEEILNELEKCARN